MQKFSVPPKLKKGQVFEGKIFIQADQPRTATRAICIATTSIWASRRWNCPPGKNLFTFPHTLPDPGFYKYDVRVEAPGDTVPQNNRASAFASVRGEPRNLVVSSDPEADQPLVAALQSAQLKVKLVGVNGFPRHAGGDAELRRDFPLQRGGGRPGHGICRNCWKARCGISAWDWFAWAATRPTRRAVIAARRWRKRCR